MYNLFPSNSYRRVGILKKRGKSAKEYSDDKKDSPIRKETLNSKEEQVISSYPISSKLKDRKSINSRTFFLDINELSSQQTTKLSNVGATAVSLMAILSAISFAN